MSDRRSSFHYQSRYILKLFEVKEKQLIDTKKPQSAGKLRLQKDISDLNIPKCCNIQFPDGIDDPMNFQVSIVPDNGYYLGYTFLFFFKVSPIYPHEAPKVKCKSKAYHPNIDLEGNVCLNILREDWKPVFDVNTIIYGLYHLLKEPNNEDPLYHDTANVSRENPYNFESTSRFKSISKRGMTITMENFPEDLVSNVLSLLPVRELLKCKCVCKSWLNLINDPCFVSKYSFNHNNLNCYDSQEGHLLIIRRKPFDMETCISIHYGNGNKPKGIFSSEAVYSFDKYNFRHRYYWSEIMGPCNGIYLLEGDPSVMLNPSLRQFKSLPDSDDTYSHGGYTGFGFDPKTNDYKVVVLSYLWLKETNKQKDTSQLYSLNSNSWRKLDDVVLPVSFRSWGTSCIYTFVNNCFHWWGYIEESSIKEDIVLSFDMVNELLRKIKVPKIHSSSLECFTTLSPFLDSSTICAINYRLGGIEKCFDVWVMKDYWDERSWIKQYSVGPGLGLSMFVGFYESNQFLWTDNNGGLMLYKLGSEQTTRLHVSNRYRIIRATRYIESLVSLVRKNAK